MIGWVPNLSCRITVRLEWTCEELVLSSKPLAAAQASREVSDHQGVCVLQRRRLLILAILATIFGAGHHVDHIIRGNHIGWPLISEVTSFTYSLGFYPFIAVGFYLYIKGRTAPLYWAFLTGVGFFLVGLTHFGPVAVEPPADIVGPYSSVFAGYAAIAWLVVFLVLLAATCLYSTYLWWRNR